MDRNLKILNFNVGGLSAHKHTEIKHFLDSNQIDILCIQESKLKSNTLKNIPGYRAEYKYIDTQNNFGFGGLITYFKNGVNYKNSEIDNVRDQNGAIILELQKFEIFLGKSPFTLFNLYSRGCDLETLEHLDKHILNTEFVLTGDFNAHNFIWGSSKTDSHGRAVEDWVSKHGLVLHNDGSSTRVDLGRGCFTCIDLTITSPKLASELGWQVTDDNLGSDHFPILISMTRSNENFKNAEDRFKFEKADWEMYKTKSGEISLTEVYHPNINLFNKSITEKFLSIARDSIPVSKPCKQNKKNVPWWNEFCENAVKERKHAIYTLKKSPSEVNLVKLKEATAHCKKVILENKTQNWADFCESCIVNPKNSRDFWNKIRRIKGTSFTPIPVLNNTAGVSITPLDKANSLVSHYAKVASDENIDPTVLAHQKQFEQDHKEFIDSPLLENEHLTLNTDFTIQELKDCISSRKNSAAGLDKIAYPMFKHMSESALKIWLIFFNKVWSEGRFPEDWKLACVIPLHKKGKDKNEPKSYRPISLTSHPGKLLEGMVKARLERLLESKNIINPLQSGFRKGRSTLDHLVRLQHDVLKSKNRGHHVLAIFLDLEAAFDLAWHSGILYKLKKHGITGRCFNYIRAFLLDRKITVKVEGTLSDTQTLTRGTPQGAIISPLLFSLLINDFPDVSEGSGMVISQFADDSGSWLCGGNIQYLQRKAQIGLDSIWRWSQEWGFKISQAKTVGILFGHKNSHQVDVSLGNTKIQFKKTVKFLGMTLDERFTLQSHINELVTKCQQDLNLMRMLKGTKFGSDKNSLLLLYKSLIRPKLDYGAEVYACAAKTNLNRLSTVQHKALVIALRALPNTPLDILEQEAGIEPLNLRREEQSLKYLARVKSRPCNPVNAIIGADFFVKARYKKAKLPFGAQVQQLAEEYRVHECNVADLRPRLESPWMLAPPVVDMSLSLRFNKNDHPPTILEITNDHISSNYSEHLKIYTDGSKDTNQTVAAAMVIPSKNVTIKKRLSNKLSIYAAELIAIQYALNWTLVNRPQKVAVLSDSLSALQSINLRNSNSRPDLIENIISLHDQCYVNDIQVKLMWCPAHVDVKGNELADRAAKDGLSCSVVDIIPLAKSEIYSIIRSVKKQKWSKGLADSTHSQPIPSEGASLSGPHRYSTCKKVDKCVTRLRLGYNLLPGSMGRFILGKPKACPKCVVPDTTEHFLLHCGVHGEARKRLSDVILRSGGQMDICTLLFPSKALRTSTFMALESYILDCQMTDKI